MTTESVKINTATLNKIRKLKSETGVSITKFIEITLNAELSYLAAKKIANSKNK